MILPRAGASIRNPDVRLPVFSADAEGYYLEMLVAGNSKDNSEVAVTRRVRLDELSAIGVGRNKRAICALSI